MRNLIVGMAASLLATAAFAQARTPPSAPPLAAAEELDPAAVEAARELLLANDFDATLERSAQLQSQAMFGTMVEAMEEQRGVDLPEELEAEMRTILMAHTESLLTEMLATALDDAARIYARYFTAEEIRELQRIQAHPVMVKLQRFGPEFMTELSMVGAAAAARRLPEVERQMREAVEGWLARGARHEPAPST